MAVAALRRLALRGPVPVHAAIGTDALAAVDDLSLDPRISVQQSPRHAAILLVAGPLRDEDRSDLCRLHDQLPHPRATVFWRTDPAIQIADPPVVSVEDDAAATIASVYRSLIEEGRPSEPDLQPDTPPNPWRGKGDHGQGGEGMMGGTPYGRPMAMTGDDLRDGLQLDPYTAEFGPFLPVFPPGLKLRITLQGDVIQFAKVLRPPLPQEEQSGPSAALRRIARQLRLLGLTGQAARALRLASVGDGKAAGVRRLRRLVKWSGSGQAIPPGLGRVGGADVRDRLAAWWEVASGETAEARAPDRTLVDLLPGLEWSEAMLVLNSFDIATLTGMCPIEKREDKAHSEEEKDAPEPHDHDGHQDQMRGAA
ncbi:hypothetical protein [Amorphus sp. 3PC139-8]|uniref:hypothetical protein n=1 Tax=Amorphus sp. 3PC139-8 TaxID=2735676 RepID=UPI00345C88AD